MQVSIFLSIIIMYFQGACRLDMTIAVDWALKNNDLSIFSGGIIPLVELPSLSTSCQAQQAGEGPGRAHGLPVPDGRRAAQGVGLKEEGLHALQLSAQLLLSL